MLRLFYASSSVARASTTTAMWTAAQLQQQCRAVSRLTGVLLQQRNGGGGRGFGGGGGGYGNNGGRGGGGGGGGYGNNGGRGGGGGGGYGNNGGRGGGGGGGGGRGFGGGGGGYGNNGGRGGGGGYGNNGGRRDGGGRGAGGRGAGGRGGGGRGGDREYLQENAQTLLQMKQQFKSAKSGRERQTIQREARRLIRRCQVDPSTQDEKSVMVLVNCAATFHSRPSEGVEAGIQWLLRRLNALTPQNVALLANAIGSVEPDGAEAMLGKDVSAAIDSGALEGMTPVEVIMVLQAFQRAEVDTNFPLQDRMLEKLISCVPSMPIPHLSTLSTVVSRHGLKERNHESWKRLADAIGSRVTSEDVSQIHSKEAITLLLSAPRLEVSPEVITLLVDRCATTAGFHTDEQVGQLLRAIHEVQIGVSDPSEALQASIQRLKAALVNRLERVSGFASPNSVASIWRFAHESNVEIPDAIQLKLLETMQLQLPFGRLKFRQMGKIAGAASLYQLPSTKFLHTIANMVLGVKPPRLDRHGKPIPLDEPPQPVDPREVAAMRKELYGRRFGQILQVRIELERALSKAGDKTADETMRRKLPQVLVEAAREAPGSQLVLAARFLGECELQEKCAQCNQANNDALLKIIEERLRRGGASLQEDVSQTAKERLAELAEKVEKLKPIAKHLK